MPDFMVTAPDGRRFRVTAPEGATQDQILAYAQQQMARADAPSFGEGVAMGAGDLVRGAEQIGARTMEANPDGGMLGRLLRSNPEIAARMDQAREVAAPRSVAETDARIQQRERDYQGRRAAVGDTGIDWGRMTGQAAVSLPAALATPTGAGMLGAATAGAVQGAALSGLQPVTSDAEPFSDQKARQVVYGTGLGAAGGATGQLVGRMLAPRVSDQVRLLHREGVTMTPGQMVGGVTQRIEDKLASFPVVGDLITNARIRGVQTFNRATAQRVLRELGEEVPPDIPAGRAMVDYVAQRVENAYQAALPRVQPFAPDQQFAQDIARVAQTRFVTPERQQRFLDFLRENVLSRARGGTLNGETFKNIDTVLGELSRRASRTTNLGDQEVGMFAREIQGALRSLVERTNPAVAPAIRAANAAHAIRVRFEGAAATRGATDGVFTPRQLSSAVQRADNSPRASAFARGDALLQDLSDAGSAVLPSTVPNSATTDRLLLASLFAGGANIAGALPASGLAAMGAGAALYATPTQRMLASILARQPTSATGRAVDQTARMLGDALAQSGGAVSVPLAGMMLSPPPPQRFDQRR